MSHHEQIEKVHINDEDLMNEFEVFFEIRKPMSTFFLEVECTRKMSEFRFLAPRRCCKETSKDFLNSFKMLEKERSPFETGNKLLKLKRKIEFLTR